MEPVVNQKEMSDMLDERPVETLIESVAPVVPETPVVPVEPVEPVTPETPVTPVVPEPPAEGTVEWYKAENERLRGEVNKYFKPDVAPVAPVTPVTPVQPTVTGDQFKWDDTDFIGNEPLDQLLDTREGLNKLLNIVASKVAELSIGKAHERTIRSIPEVVTSYVTNMSTVKAIHDEFYAKNEDLVPFKRVCAGIANKISAERPDFTAAQVFEETAKQTRQTLGLLNKTKTITNQGPAFAGPSGSRHTAVSLKGLEKEIDDLIK